MTANYYKSDDSELHTINIEAKKVTEHLRVADRINEMPLKEAFVTLKDHKEGFNSAPKCRLINPTKSNVGKISKVLLDDINKKIIAKTELM